MFARFASLSRASLLWLGLGLVPFLPLAAQAYNPPGTGEDSGLVLEKQCGTPVLLPNGDYSVDCVLALAVDAFGGPVLSDVQFYLQDILTDAAGTPQPGWITSAPGCLVMPGGPGWDCTVPAILWQASNPLPVTLPLTTVSLTIPAGTSGPLENCVSLSATVGLPMPGNPPPATQLTQACATIELPKDPPPPFTPGGQCVAFTPEVSCDPVSGLPMVTLSNAYSGSFSPGAVHITSLTPGVTVTAGSSLMSVLLTGAMPGSQITLMTEAMEPGAGSAEGLDLCCMGTIEVEIPTGLICEIPPELTVEKTCTPGEYPSGANIDCEITVTYSGPPPTASTPLFISDTVSSGPWSVVAFIGASHNWACAATPHIGPAPWGCTIIDTDEPGADWSAFTSTIIVQMSTDEAFENCAEASATGGLSDESCWSNIPPEIEITKTGPAECQFGAPCDYTISLTAGPGGYTGTLLLTDQAPAGYDIVAVTPPIAGCLLPANPLACPVAVGLAGSASQTYTMTIQTNGSVPGPITGENCAGLYSQSPGGELSPAQIADLLKGVPVDEACVPVIGDEFDCEDGFELVNGICTLIETETPAYTLEKTCEEGPASLACTITLTTNGVPFTGSITVTDVTNLTATAGSTITAPVGTCSNTTMDCSFTAADLAGLTPPNTVIMTVTLPPVMIVDGFMNCANGSNPQIGPQQDCWVNGTLIIPDTPPPLSASCSSNYIFVVDSSGSIGTNVGEVSGAVRNMAQILNGNGSQASLILFNSNASLVQPMSTTALNSMANNYGTLFTPGGSTNWEAALTLAALQPSANATIIFITDGRPTAFLDPSGVPVVLPDGPATWMTATNEAIPVVNQIYAAGVPIIGIGIAGPGEGSFVSTYLDALLGTSTAGSTFASLNADLTALAYTLCADLHLTKLINGSPYAGVNFHSVTGDSYTMTVTLRALNSTSADLHTVVIEDLLPANLTYLGNTLPIGAPVVSLGQLVRWTAPLIAAGTTETVSFDIAIARPAPEVTNCSWQTNFAQVQSLTETLLSVAGNMNAASGPDVESDEASARYCAFDQPPNPPGDCSAQYLEVRKTAVEESCFVGQPCEFVVNVRPRQCHVGGFTGDVVFGDAITAQPGGSTVPAVVTSITNTHTTPICAFPSDWSGTTLPIGCATPVTLAQGSSITFNVSVTAPAEGDYTQCFVAEDRGLPLTPAGAIASANPPTAPLQWQPRGNCVTFSVSPPPGINPQGEDGGGTLRSTPAPVLTISKTLQDACRTSARAQQHECDFALVVTNTGDAPFAGPLALSDHFAGLVPLGSQVQSAADWTCNARGDGASCVNGSVTLEPGQSTGLVMTLTLPGGPRPAHFENCAALGVGPGEAEQTLLAQRVMQILGIDGGPVDGMPGRQTRAGLRLLFQQLGLAPQEQVTPALLAALGLSEAGVPVCVGVDLPAIARATPRPTPTPDGLACERATTIERGGACVCRYEGMVRLDAQRCGCGQGQQFQAGQGCVRAAVTPAQGPRCDPQTTVQVGNTCECRAPGMIRRNATSCGCPQGSQMIGALGCVGITLPVPGVRPRAGP